MTTMITNIIFQTTAEQQIEEQRIRFKKVKSSILVKKKMMMKMMMMMANQGKLLNAGLS